MSGEKTVEILYFYSDLYENKRVLLSIVKKLQRRKSIRVRLINVEDPKNEELTEAYDVNSVPLIVFLTSGGEVASRKSMHLSETSIIDEIANQIVNGNLPNPHVNDIKRKILEAFKSISARNELMQIMIEQVRSDILEADSEAEIYDALSFHISTINHTIKDLEEFKRKLQGYMQKQHAFIV